MGNMKVRTIGMDEARFDAWAAQHHPGVEPDTLDWDAIGQCYSDWQDFQAEQPDKKCRQEEFIASLENVPQRYRHASTELRKLRALLETPQQEIVYRISYVHAVTVMEAYLMYCARALLEHDWPLRRFRDEYYLESGRIKKTVKDATATMDISRFRPIARKFVSKLTFHNVNTIKHYFQTVLHLPPSWPLEPLDIITQWRNDLVHRNGVTEDDVPVDISPQGLRYALQKVDELIDAADRSMRDELILFGNGNWRPDESREILACSLGLFLPGETSNDKT